MHNAAKYGFNISENEKYTLGKTKIIKVNGKIDNLYQWAKSQNNLYKDVKILNPWILTDQLPLGN